MTTTDAGALCASPHTRDVGKNGCMAEPTQPTVLVFAAGGTLGMRETDRGLSVDPNFPTALDAKVADICDSLGTKYRINHAATPIDSANAGADTATRIAAAVRSRARTLRPDGVVVLHGTDTMAYIAARLAFDLDTLSIPVIVTGSQLPLADPASDAPANLRLALRVALNAARDAPVTIAFGKALIPAVRATKQHSSDRDAFCAVRPLSPGATGTAALEIEGTGSHTAARVISFRFVPGVTAHDLRAAVGANPNGLVLECYGSGTAPTDHPDMADALREICDRMPVVAVTQCERGEIRFGQYAVGRRVASCGVLDGGDMTLEAAIAKLGHLLDRGATRHEIGQGIQMNLAGERLAHAPSAMIR